MESSENSRMGHYPMRDPGDVTLLFRLGKTEFAFNVEPKDYKRENAKSRVNMGWSLKPNEKNRERLRRFFSEIVKTDQDP